MAVIDFFDRGWRSNPDGPAYVVGERSWTYQQSGEQSCRVAHALLRRFSGRRPHVAVLSENDPDAWACVLGTWRAGMAWLPLNPAYPAPELRRLLDGFDAEVVFFQRSFLDVVRTIWTLLPQVTHWVCLDDSCDDEGVVPLEEWLGDAPCEDPGVAFDPDDVVAIMPTGGTTGMPKGVMNTHRSLSTAFTHLMLAFHYDEGERPVNLAAAPMTHASGMLTLACSARGGTVVVLTRAEPAAVLAAMVRHAVTELFLPPTVIYRLLKDPDLGGADLSALRYLLYGSAPIAVDRLRVAIELLGPVLIGGYGQMEAPMAISFLRPEEHLRDGEIADDARLSSCGRVYPLVRVQIQDDAGRPVAPRQRGEICVRGDLVMKGYYRAPELTEAAIVDGWLHTGDIGFLDDDDYLHISDRKKDLIISGGYNVYPNEVEQVLAAHPGVGECAVVGMPDSEWGERVTAFVERASTAVTPAELIAWCKDQLGSVRSPKDVVFVETLPKSPAGKVLKKALREATGP